MDCGIAARLTIHSRNHAHSDSAATSTFNQIYVYRTRRFNSVLSQRITHNGSANADTTAHLDFRPLQTR